jgi:holo-[acyl-carrier protein] synthase
MILGIGLDTVDIERFNDWHTHSKEKLQKIFSEEEITYCLESPTKSAERFAVRFAAREALFKALGSYKSDHIIPFLTLCKKTKLLRTENGIPRIELDWKYIKEQINLDRCKIFISLTHTQHIATAWIILEK